jgi:hypothetical protein
MAISQLAYQPSNHSGYIVVEHDNPSVAQDRFTIFIVLDRKHGTARPLGSSRVGSNDLEAIKAECDRLEANRGSASEAGQVYA